MISNLTDVGLGDMVSVRSIIASSTAAFPIFQAIGAVGIVAAIATDASWGWWTLAALVYFLVGCLGVTVTYHRCLAHRAFRMRRWKEYLFSVLGALGAAGSPLGWVALHRYHHAFADTPHDPHSPHPHFWRPLFGQLEFSFDKWAVRRMATDPFHRILHKYYHLWLLGWALLLLALDPRVMLFGFVVPAGVLLNVSSLSNVLNHGVGYRNFETRDRSTNNPVIALLAWGEGWHNNHHHQPVAWNLSRRWWELDPTAWIIRLVREQAAPTSGGETRATAPVLPGSSRSGDR